MWGCLVVEFAEEFGISVSYDPLVWVSADAARALDGLRPQQTSSLAVLPPGLSLILLVVGLTAVGVARISALY